MVRANAAQDNATPWVRGVVVAVTLCRGFVNRPLVPVGMTPVAIIVATVTVIQVDIVTARLTCGFYSGSRCRLRRALLTISTVGACVLAGILAGSKSLGFPVYVLLAAIAAFSSFSTP